MSLLNEEEVFQRADTHILEWKQELRSKYCNAFYQQEAIRVYIGYTEIDWTYNTEKLFDWIEKNNKWIELEKAIKRFVPKKYEGSFGLEYDKNWDNIYFTKDGQYIEPEENTWFGEKTFQKLDNSIYDYAFY